ncbi:hypothetical protein F3Y22_tig00110330pilonHSYRG00025 [Hibiscus syriacus]|uniref:Pentatricopeptide repeat-containing protein n=1 Tax=Hibiscus syriacus TaxID=106335 RepID=A0A6A3AYG3_HIBSY|nr:hypothetical protein F3Y22_tig00110330pilonHSYRG00025 [Hibiscus syriacus]
MARMSIRELLRFRYTIFANPTLLFSPQNPITDFHRRFILPSREQARFPPNNPFDSRFVSRYKETVSNPSSLDYFGSLPKPFLGGQGFDAFLKVGIIPFRSSRALGILMRAHGCFVRNSYTFVPLLSSCSKMDCSKSARKCHGQAIKFGVVDNLPVCNCLIHTYGCCGILEFANKVFLEMSRRDIASWNSFIDAYLDKWWELDLWGMRRLWLVCLGTGFMGNEKTVASVLSVCSKSARLKEGRSVHEFLIKNGMKSNIIIDTALVNVRNKL